MHITFAPIGILNALLSSHKCLNLKYSRMPPPVKRKRKLPTPEKKKHNKTQIDNAISDAEGDGRTDMGNTICSFSTIIFEWWRHKKNEEEWGRVGGGGGGGNLTSLNRCSKSNYFLTGTSGTRVSGCYQKTIYELVTQFDLAINLHELACFWSSKRYRCTRNTKPMSFLTEVFHIFQ